MVELLALIGIGFVLGMRHATDPDHVIAITTIVTDEGKISRAALIGAIWGLGHTLTILAVGSAIILFRLVLPPRLGLSMEFAVALMLILLGLRNLGVFSRRASSAATAPDPADTHRHGGIAHTHAAGGVSHTHTHGAGVAVVAALDRRAPHSRLYFFMRPLLIGLVHGMAGSAAVALLVLSTISNPRWASAYLGVFGVGTIMGMMLITLAIGTTFSVGRKRFGNLGRHFGVAAGAISLIFGLFVTYQIGWVNGLFTSHVHWTPH